MSDKKHIDRLFQERLKDFEATPSPAVWEQIDAELAQGKKDRKVIPIWWRIAGIAAGIILLITIGNSLMNSDQSNVPEESVVESESTEDSNNKNNSDVKNIQSLEQDEVASETTENNAINEEVTTENAVATDNQKAVDPSVNGTEANTLVNNTPEQRLKNQKKQSVDSNESNRLEKAVAETNDQKGEDILPKDNNLMIDKEKANELIDANTKDAQSKLTNAVDNDTKTEENDQETNTTEEEKLSLTDELKSTEEASDELVEDKEEKGKRWSVLPNIAPVYFGSFGSGSSIDDNFNNNSKKGDINLSYGVMATYDINDKLSLRAGVNQVNLGYSTNDIVVYNNIDANDGSKPLKNVDLNENSQNLSFLSASGLNFAEVPAVLANTIQSSIDQELGFIEVPVEVEYKISQKKLGVSVIGGFSALFLNRNEVYSSLQGTRNLLGEATNINNTSFSANVGLGVDYNVSKRIKLNLEPVLKYQLNTFNDTSGNFNPYFIGIYSGISFKF